VSEDVLYSDECELRSRENEFYKTFGPDLLDEGSQPSSADVSPPASEKLSTTNEHLPPTTNPLYDYERKIGWAVYLHEEILQMVQDRDEILREQQQQNISSEQMDQGDLKFLETYEEIFAS